MKIRHGLPMSVLCFVIVIVATACPGQPPAKPEEVAPPPPPVVVETLDIISSSDVYRLARDAVLPLAEKYLGMSNTVVLVNMTGFTGSDSWRFKPDVPVKDFNYENFLSKYPYFIDSFEGGMQEAVLSKDGKGFERLRLSSLNPDVRQQVLDGKLVFGTSVLSATSWTELAKNPVNAKLPYTRMLQYSIENVIYERGKYIGILVNFRLLDLSRGTILYNATTVLRTKQFPEDQMASLGQLRLTIPEAQLNAPAAAIARAIKNTDTKAFSNSIALIKNDDFSVFGGFPVTKEDFVVEDWLQGFFASIPDVVTVEKLNKKEYKQPWQLTNSVSNINPVQIGQASDFPGFYGARFLVSYRILWKTLEGTRKSGDGGFELADQILGIYLKIIDLGANNTIVYADFLPLGTFEAMESNVLYRCFSYARKFETPAKTLAEKALLQPGSSLMLINRRMEIANNYVAKNDTVADLLRSRSDSSDTASIWKQYRDTDKVLSAYGTALVEDTSYGEFDQLNILFALNLMSSWFEEGLTGALLARGISVAEKIDELYSRSQIFRLQQASPSDMELRYLSPILLQQWGPSIKSFYNVDKFLYFSFNDNMTPLGKHSKVPAAYALSRFYPLLSDSPDSLQLGLVDVDSGNYLFKQDFNIK